MHRAHNPLNVSVLGGMLNMEGIRSGSPEAYNCVFLHVRVEFAISHRLSKAHTQTVAKDHAAKL